jgi:hypothetical protein
MDMSKAKIKKEEWLKMCHSIGITAKLSEFPIGGLSIGDELDFGYEGCPKIRMKVMKITGDQVVLKTNPYTSAEIGKHLKPHIC